MTRWTAILPLALILSLSVALPACSSNKQQAARNAARKAEAARRAGAQASLAEARERVRTTDTGSRYVDVARPVGGITVETSPIAGGALVLPYVGWQGSGASQIGQPDSQQATASGVLPAPALPPRGRSPPPPPPPDWP